MSAYYDKRKRHWVARKFQKGVNVFIGCYKTESDAIEAVEHFIKTGEKLEREETKLVDYYHSKGLSITYPKYDDLRKKYKNQVRQLTESYR